MRTYETIVIIKPQLSDQEVAEFVDQLKKMVSQDGGEVVSEEKLGRRKLTHAIHHIREGFYSYMKFRAAPQFVEKIQRLLKVNDSVLRMAVMVAQEPAAVKADK